MEDFKSNIISNQLNIIQNIENSFLKADEPQEGEERDYKDGRYKFIEGHWKKIDNNKKEENKNKLSFKIEKERIYKKNPNYYIDHFKINGIEIVSYEKGSDYYCTIKNGSPSKIRDKHGITNEVSWDIQGLKQILGEDKFPKNWRDSLFYQTSGGPDLTWGYKGPTITQEVIKGIINYYLQNNNDLKKGNDNFIEDKFNIIYNGYKIVIIPYNDNLFGYKIFSINESNQDNYIVDTQDYIGDYEETLNDAKSLIDNLSKELEKGIYYGSYYFQPGQEGEIRKYWDGEYIFEQGHWHKIRIDQNKIDLENFKIKLDETNNKLEYYLDKKNKDIAFNEDEKKDYKFLKNYKIYLDNIIKKLKNKIERKQLKQLEVK